METLSYEQAPPLSVPFRFFVSAPVFGLFAAVLVAWQGPAIFDSRWMPAALGGTHLLTLGFLASIMTGAMMQILPVLVGATLPAPRTVAWFTHVTLCAGTLALAGGFVLTRPTLLGLAVVLLGAGFAVFVAAVVASLARVRAWNTTVGVMWLVAIALSATVAFGAALAASRGFGIALPAGALYDLHPGWGLLGWVGVLVIGVAYQVVPMFQMTPAYSDRITSWLTWTIFATLALWSLAAWLGEAGEALSHGLALALAAAYAAFALVTLGLQRRRRRRLADVTLDFWRMGMVCMIAAAVAWALRLTGAIEVPDRFDVFLGVLTIVGVAVSVVNGMLYKIAPFLVWFHLQTECAGRAAVPHMKKILGDAAQRAQFRVHLVAASLLLGAAWWTPLAHAGGLVFALSMALLLRNLLAVLGVYRETRARAESVRTAA